jgi:Protein of unknown function (DUF5132)
MHGRYPMALFEDAVKSWGLPVLVGAGVVLALPVVLPVVGSALRPMAKAAIKGYMALADSVAEGAATLAEEFSDLVAEVRAERATALTASVPPREPSG